MEKRQLMQNLILNSDSDVSVGWRRWRCYQGHFPTDKTGSTLHTYLTKPDTPISATVSCNSRLDYDFWIYIHTGNKLYSYRGTRAFINLPFHFPVCFIILSHFVFLKTKRSHEIHKPLGECTQSVTRYTNMWTDLMLSHTRPLEEDS